MRAFMHKSVKLPKYIPTPKRDWVLTQNVQPKEITTPSGIVLAQDEVREDLAAVIAVGEGYPHHEGPIPLHLKPGDIVRTTRKKGRTAYLDCMGDFGAGDTQTAYNYYQIGEIIAVEYHSELLAQEIEKIAAAYPAVVTLEEELEYDRLQAEKKQKGETSASKMEEVKKKKASYREELKAKMVAESEELMEDTFDRR